MAMKRVSDFGWEMRQKALFEPPPARAFILISLSENPVSFRNETRNALNGFPGTDSLRILLTDLSLEIPLHFSKSGDNTVYNP